MKAQTKLSLLVLILSLFLVSQFTFVRAGREPQENPWAEVIDENGNILFANLTDLGEIQVAADWMPDIPFIDIQATYHEYLTPSGNVVLLPSASTLFFMALDQEASGFNQADSMLGNGAAALETMLAGYLTGAELQQMGYTNPDDFFQAVIDGNENIWSFGGQGVMNFLSDLISGSLADGNLYTLLVLYTAGNCDAVPGGCPAGPQDLLPTPPLADFVCPSPFITTSPIAITGGSGEGGKIAPLNPVVVGQDPEQRGVDIQVNAAIPPIVYHTFEKVRHEELGCKAVVHGGSGCPDHPRSPYYTTTVDVWYECIEHTRTYPDNLASAQVFVNLTQASRQWILTDLAQAYPGAHLLHPDFTFSFGSGGSTWSMIIPRIQTADPGDYTATVAVRTTGTPVSAPRTTRLGIGQFNVALVRVSLIDGP